MSDYYEKVPARCSRMWWKMGSIMEKSAYEHADGGAQVAHAMKLARAAEACFWQAAGDGDVCSTKDFEG